MTSYVRRRLAAVGLVLALTILAALQTSGVHATAHAVDGPEFASAQLPVVSPSLLVQDVDLMPICRLGGLGVGRPADRLRLDIELRCGALPGFRLERWERSRDAGCGVCTRLVVSQDRPDDPVDVNLPVACGLDYGYSVAPALTDAGLGAQLAVNPGHLWIVGNEPDRRISQNDTCPQQYAQAYHDAYHFIKSRDSIGAGRGCWTGGGDTGTTTVPRHRMGYLSVAVW